MLLRLQIRDIGSGNFGVARLCRDKTNSQLVAIKFIGTCCDAQQECLQDCSNG
jgi:hypothetical protein